MFRPALIVLALAAACGSSAPPVSEPGAPTALTRSDVSVDDLAKAIEAGATVLDVRTPEEWAEGHVPGATLLPVDQVDPRNHVVEALPKDKPIYVVCKSGGRSARAADRLAAAGYQALNVLGGTDAWRDQGRQIVVPGAEAPAPEAAPPAGEAAPAAPAEAAPAAAPTPTP